MLSEENTAIEINIARFYLACREGNKDLVEDLIDNGLDVNVTNENGDTGLICAAIKGQDNIVTFLIKCGALLDKQDIYGNTALMYACGKGYKNIVKSLIDNGADANIRNNRNETAIVKACLADNKHIVYFLLRHVQNLDLSHVKILIWACGNGYTKIIEELLRMKININETYSDNDMPLLMTHSGKIPRTVRLSLEHTNDFVSINRWLPVNGDTPLLMACVGGYTNIVKILLSYDIIDVNTQNENSNSPLLIACIGGYKKIVELLLEKGANPNIRNLNGWVPLVCATYSERYSIVELLLNYGADVNITDNTGNTALMFACDKSNEKLVNLLLRYNAKIDIIDDEEDTSLIRACMENNERIIEMLLTHTKECMNLRERIMFVNSSNSVKQTALMWASDIGNLSIIKILIDSGAYIDCEDIHGDTAFMWACSAENFDVAKFLLKNQANINDLEKRNFVGKTFLMRLCETCKSVNLLNWLVTQYRIKNGEDKLKTLINEMDDQGLTALMYACNEDFLELVYLLLKNGADVNAKDINGNTALHITCRDDGTSGIIDLLLEYKIDVDVENLNGNTPIHMACGNNLINKTQFLIQHGANIEKTDLQGDNALHIACIYQSIDVIPFLIEKGIDINVPNKMGKTPLIIVCSRENEDIASILVKKGANVNHSDIYQNTALNIVCARNNVSMGRLLILHFANLYSLSKVEKDQRENYINLLKQTSNLKIKIRIALYQKDLNKLREYLNECFIDLNVERNTHEKVSDYVYRVMSTNLVKLYELKKFIYGLNNSEEIKKLKMDNIDIANINNKLKINPLMNVENRYNEFDLNKKIIMEVELFCNIVNEATKRNIVNSVSCAKDELKHKKCTHTNKNKIDVLPENIIHNSIPNSRESGIGI